MSCLCLDIVGSSFFEVDAAATPNGQVEESELYRGVNTTGRKTLGRLGRLVNGIRNEEEGEECKCCCGSRSTVAMQRLQGTRSRQPATLGRRQGRDP